MATENFSGTLSNWTQWNGGWGNAYISSGVLKFAAGQDVGITWSGAGAGSFGAAQESAADISGATWTNQYAGVGVRMSGSNATRSGYFARLHDNASTNKTLALLKIVNGTPTTLQTTTYATGSTFRLRITVEDSGADAVLKVYVGATLVSALNHTDSTSPLSGGDPGLLGRDASMSVDDWEGGTLAVTSSLSGEAILSGVTADGGMSTLPNSSLSGEAVLAGVAADGGMGLAPGVITTPVLKNNAGTILASVIGIVANVYNPTTGVLVVRKTGLASDGSGIVTISDVLLSAGTAYAYEIDLSATSQGRRLPTGVAA